jgi:hypothetical protein
MAEVSAIGQVQADLKDGSIDSVSVTSSDAVTKLIAGDDPEQDLNTFFILSSGFLVRPPCHHKYQARRILCILCLCVGEGRGARDGT